MILVIQARVGVGVELRGLPRPSPTTLKKLPYLGRSRDSYHIPVTLDAPATAERESETYTRLRVARGTTRHC